MRRGLITNRHYRRSGVAETEKTQHYTNSCCPLSLCVCTDTTKVSHSPRALRRWHCAVNYYFLKKNQLAPPLAWTEIRVARALITLAPSCCNQLIDLQLLRQWQRQRRSTPPLNCRLEVISFPRRHFIRFGAWLIDYTKVTPPVWVEYVAINKQVIQ